MVRAYCNNFDNPEKVEPIKPDEVLGLKKNLMPPEVIDVCNKLIACKWDGNRSFITQDEILSAIRERLCLVNNTSIFANKWRDRWLKSSHPDQQQGIAQLVERLLWEQEDGSSSLSTLTRVILLPK